MRPLRILRASIRILSLTPGSPRWEGRRLAVFMNMIKKKKPPSVKVKSKNPEQTTGIKTLAVVRSVLVMKRGKVTTMKTLAIKITTPSKIDNLKMNCKIL